MKKEYMSPQAIVVKIHTQKMIAQSANGASIMSGSASTENDVLGRRGSSLWDDDEDEDY